jgi:hypothetical protein
MNCSNLFDALRRVSDALEAEGVVYAITGSVASSIHGEPVTSIDVDLVVNMSPEQAGRVVERLGPQFYADAGMLREAATNRTLVNVYDQALGMKFDLSVLSDTPYHAQVMARRVKVAVPGSDRSFWTVTPEDIVLMKLVWRKGTGSRKQWENALGVVRTKGSTLDWDYLRRWAAELGVMTDLDAMSREAGL